MKDPLLKRASALADCGRPRINEQRDAELAERAAKRAIRIVRKFSQIEQFVIAPALTREIAMALLEAYREVRK